MQNKISTIIFDYGGVIELSDLNLVKGIIEILGITREEWSNVYYAHNYLTNVEGKGWKEVALLVSEKLGATPDQINDIKALIKEIEGNMKLNTELIEIINKLKSVGYKTAIISNYTSILRKKIIKQEIHDSFDEIIISAEEGYQKPDPKIFEITYKKLGVSAGETVFVDDSPSSLSTATEIGYTPILFTDNITLKKDLSTILNISL